MSQETKGEKDIVDAELPFGSSPEFDERLKRDQAEPFNLEPAETTLELSEDGAESNGYARDLEKLLRKFSELEGVRKMTTGSDLAADIQTIAEVHKFLKDQNISEAEKIKLYGSNPQFLASRKKIEQYLKDFKKTTEVVGVKRGGFAAGAPEPEITANQNIKQEDSGSEATGESIQTAKAPESLETGHELETAIEKAMKKTEPKLRTAVEIAMEKTDAILKESEGTIHGAESKPAGPGAVGLEKKTEPDRLDSLVERARDLKKINPREGMFQGIGTEKERQRAAQASINEIAQAIKEEVMKDEKIPLREGSRQKKRGFWSRLFGS